MNYAISRQRQTQKDMSYRIFVTDALKALAGNTSKFGGSYMRVRWADTFSQKKQDERTGEQIVADVIRKTGIKLITSPKVDGEKG